MFDMISAALIFTFFWFNRCLIIRDGFKCDRYCNKITTATVNVYLKYDDNLYTADCKRAIAFNKMRGNESAVQIDPVEIWADEKNKGVLFGSCKDVVKTSNNEFRYHQ